MCLLASCEPATRAADSPAELTTPQAYPRIKHLSGVASQFAKCVTLPQKLSLPGVMSIRLRHVVMSESNLWVAKLHRRSHRPHHSHSKVNSGKLRQTFFFFSPMPGQRHLTIPVTSAVPPSLAAVPATVSVLALLPEDYSMKRRCRDAENSATDSRTLSVKAAFCSAPDTARET